MRAQLQIALDRGHIARETHAALADLARKISGMICNRAVGNFGRIRPFAACHEQPLRARIEVDIAARKDAAANWAQHAETLKCREWEAAEKVLSVAHRVLNSFANRDPEKISLNEVSKALEVVSRLGRLATCLATEHQQVKAEVTGADVTAVIEACHRGAISRETLLDCAHATEANHITHHSGHTRRG